MQISTEIINKHQIVVKSWHIENCKASLLIVHGFAEHSTRYQHVAEFFNANQISVMSFDLLGHGQSEGTRAYVEKFEEYEFELAQMCKIFVDKYRDSVRFIMGHSMGGLIVSLNAINTRLCGIENVILSNPAFDIVSNQPKILVAIVRILAKIFPKMQTVKLDSKYISRDPEIRRSYDTDPLNYRKGSRPGMVNEFDKAGKRALEQASNFKQNVYLNYSSTDKTIAPEGSVRFFKRIGSKDKKIQNYEGLYHELLNEPEKLQIMENILAWMIERIKQNPK